MVIFDMDPQGTATAKRAADPASFRFRPDTGQHDRATRKRRRPHRDDHSISDDRFHVELSLLDQLRNRPD